MMRRRDLIVGGGAIASASAMAVDRNNQGNSRAPTADAEPLKSTKSDVLDPSFIDARLDTRSVSFENPTGARGGGGRTGNGRKGQPFYILEPAERVVLADLKGPGTVRHVWMTFSSLPPQSARAQRLEVFYDGSADPSISVPVLDFFGLPHGRLSEYYSALISINDGRGLNSHIPMPYRHSIRIEYTNESQRHVSLYHQIDYTLEHSVQERPSYLHVSFRRENPTTLLRDFVVADHFKGPGRFLGCSVGIRVLNSGWYGEGEVKVYRDGDRTFPTYCGTGLEDYVGSAWGMKRHYGPYSGVPINITRPSPDTAKPEHPAFVGFYRWHLPDPIMFSETIQVTIQQIGASEEFKMGQEAAYAAYKSKHIAAGAGWIADSQFFGDSLGFAIVERIDDYCAAAFVYCTEPQPVQRYTVAAAVSDIGWLAGEKTEDTTKQEDDFDRFLIGFKRHWGAQINRRR